VKCENVLVWALQATNISPCKDQVTTGTLHFIMLLPRNALWLNCYIKFFFYTELR